MKGGSSVFWMGFVLLLVFMLLIYYQGLVADVGQVGTTVGNLGFVFSGRTLAGQPVNYPKAA